MAEDKPSKAKQGLTHSTLVGFFWSFFGTGTQAVLNFLVLGVTARLLTPAETGLVSIANIFTVFASLLYQLGIGPSLIQRQQINDDHIRSGFTLTIIMGVALTIFTWLFAPVFASFFPKISGLTEVTRGLSFLFIINGVGSVARSLNHRNLNFRIKARFDVTANLIGYGFVGVGLAFLGFGAWALVWASLIQSAVYSALFLWVSPHPKGFQLSRTALKDLLSFGSGLTIGEIFNRIGNTADNLVVASTLGDRAAGLYGRAYGLLALPAQYFGQVIDKVLFTAMSKVQDQPKTIKKVYRQGVVTIALIVMPLSAFLFVLAPEFVHTLLGRQWSAIIVPFKIFSVTMLFRTSYKMGDALCRASGTVFPRALRQFIFSSMIILGAWLGHYQGIVGVTVGVSLAIALHFFSMAQLSLRITRMRWGEFLSVHVPALLLTTIVAGESWLLAYFFRGFAWPDPAVLFGSAAVIGFTLLLLIWALPKLLLGDDGLWILKMVSGYLPKSVQVQMNKLQYR